MKRNPLSIVLVALLAISAAPCAEAADAPLPDEIKFNRDIRPILSDRCFACHGPDANKRKAKLRLDTEDGVFKKLDSGAIVTPGKPEASELWKRIISSDEEERMPLAKIGSSFLKPLSDREKALVKRWIEQGAKWEGHWAYITPVKPPVPDMSGLDGVAKDFIRNPIDHFVLRKHREQNLRPTKEADRRTLIRRLSFDIRGLPPTAAEADAFAKDTSPDAYEKLVDRLLADKHFGERMAVYWLDLVRYADSAGYHSDNERNVWLYRDYVINAFNNNKRFDVFTKEQFAGDLLPDADWEQKIASGYNRLLNTTEEGGAQAKEYTAKYLADRVRNASTVWLGATMGCCECHDHKYDPLPQKDFYSLGAFFADVQETPVGRQGQTPVVTPEHQAKIAELDAKIADVNKRMSDASASLAAAQKTWEAELSKKVEGGTRSDMAWVADRDVPKGATKDGTWDYISKEQGPTRDARASRKQEAGELVQHFVIGAKEMIDVGKGDVFFAYIYLDPKNPPKQVMLQFNDGSWEHRAWWGGDHIPFGGNGTNGVNHRKLGDLPKAGQWVRLEVQLSDVGLSDKSKINGMAFTQWGGLAYWADAGVNRDGLGLPEAVVKALQKEVGKRSDKEREAIASHYRSIAPQLEPLRNELKSLAAQREAVNKALPTTLITTATSPRTVRLLPRGNWLDDSGEVMSPQVPSAYGELKAAEGKRLSRLDLSNWLVSKENPVVARVFVNRLWKLFYGEGLVRTLEDFGSQGDWPTHPELLDWLAMEFVDSGFDVKHMIRLMATAGTYRQSSDATPQAMQRDLFNHWLARQGRFRLSAEFIRDNALAVSGLLTSEIGGPSVKPYQPRGYWQHLNFPKREWQNDKGSDQYRRGLYTWWQRSFLQPSLLAFDASSREEAVCARPRSNTPLQALAMLNDPTYVEASRAFAQGIMKDGGKSPVDRLAYAFDQALQRKPSSDESKVLLAMYEKHRAQYAADAAAAAALLKEGDKPADASLDAAELAAWSSVSRVILNLHESITRE
ncbi:MAG: PSD1 and planctomycete cytochrome C domain-containing protein [Phycisphaeraceae bacterium]